jgi:hypothetical protein
VADGDPPTIYQPVEPLPEDLAHPGPHDDRPV